MLVEREAEFTQFLLGRSYLIIVLYRQEKSLTGGQRLASTRCGVLGSAGALRVDFLPLCRGIDVFQDLLVVGGPST